MEVYEAIRGRRSIMHFKSTPVPRDVLERIMEAALWAPSVRDEQNWYFVVLGGRHKGSFLQMLSVRFAKVLAALSQEISQRLAAEQTSWFLDAARRAPVLIVVFSEKGHQDSLDYALSVAAAVQNLLLAAWSEGIGTRWFTGGLYAIQDEVSEQLGIRDKELMGLIVLGYPEEIPEPTPRRKDRIEFRM